MTKKQEIKKENPTPTYAPSKKVKPKKEKKLSDCGDSIKKVNEILDERSTFKVNTLENCYPKEEKCNCSEPSGKKVGIKTDLIVLIDTSGSVYSSAQSISKAVSNAIEKAKEQCEPDLKITYLGLDGIWSGTVFTESHRSYIYRIHGSIPLSSNAPINSSDWKPMEQGAMGIKDLSKYADWRKDACRAILYISDEELDSSVPRNDFANETAATNQAIAEANSNNVTVFAHHLTYQNLNPQIIQNYQDLCSKTGGKAYFSKNPNEKEYVNLLSDVICNSCGVSSCKDVELPNLKPCISIKWGDSKCDCIESSDYELMTITICNCYSNIEFSNFVISSIEVTDTLGKPVAILPNGTPSIKLHPIGVYCFGNIEPCSCISREFVVITEGAKEGKYKLDLKGICFNISIPQHQESDCFTFNICKD